MIRTMNDYYDLIGNACQSYSIAVSSSISSIIWQMITFLWPWNWIWISLAIVAWILWEVKTRYGNAHYNSANGFSPAFNRFIGSGMYTLTQIPLFLVLSNAYGGKAYCFRLPYALHIGLFSFVGLILYFSGFWPYLKEPGRKRARKYRRLRRLLWFSFRAQRLCR